MSFGVGAARAAFAETPVESAPPFHAIVPQGLSARRWGLVVDHLTRASIRLRGYSRQLAAVGHCST
jgi:hypothetical protein